MPTEGFRRHFPPAWREWTRRHPKIVNALDRVATFGGRNPEVYNDVVTLLSFREREFLHRLVFEYARNGLVVEIGTYAGGSACIMGRAAKKVGGRVITIDPYHTDRSLQIQLGDDSFYLKDFDEKPTLDEVTKTIERAGLGGVVALLSDFSHAVATDWQHGPIDVLVIDGNKNETYDDFEAWEPHLATRSVVAIHDSAGPNASAKARQDVESMIRFANPSEVEYVDSLTVLYNNNRTLEDLIPVA